MEAFPEPIGLVVVDVSFIGLEKVLPSITRAASGAPVVALFKPQFQVERGQVGRGGIVRDPEAVEAAMRRFREWCGEHGIDVVGESPSELPGTEGNREIFVHLRPVAG
jgi:23S rRNA (cytidine1920-2'-O)/16S rRNA (cytidine1409-2'-O)-methyltransferase